MSFIRPPVVAHFTKWREAYFVTGILLFGIWLYLRGSASLNLILQGLGLLVSLAGIILLRTTIQRIRFKRGQKAPGMVDVTEREISYFGPMHGKTISLESLNKIELRESEAYAAIWVLHHSEGDPMIVPTTAKGSDRLFDAFTSLSGVKMDVLVAAINQTPIQAKVIWQRS
ncbi:MAG: hypothetical protein JKX71_14795 [Amylibacter sp.]|nr:hypothetical protein [Amylibacter sp.]